MSNNNYIFNLIKENNFEEIYNLIENKTLKNLDIKDNNYNYFIHYIINYNQINILNLIIELKLKNLINIKIDILERRCACIGIDHIPFKELKHKKTYPND